MKTLRISILAICAVICSRSFGQNPVDPWSKIPGSLGFPFGTYHTIEGFRLDRFKTGTNTLAVDTIDGKKLPAPIAIWIENIPDLPEKDRVILKGYETGRFFGSPNLPKEETERWGVAQAGFHFGCSFIPTTIVAPAALKFEIPPIKERKPASESSETPEP